MLTGRGGAVAVGSVALLGVGRLLGVPELYVIAAATGVLVVCAVLAVRAASTTVSVRRSLTAPRLLVDGAGEAVLELRNASRLPAALLLVSDDCDPTLADRPRFVVPGLRPGRTVALRYPIVGSVRGRRVVGPLSVRVRDPFGLAERSRRYAGTDEVLVYPRVEALTEGPARGLHQGTGASETRRLFSTGDEFYTMREYVQGDDLRQVHWPSTAHRSRLMVRQQELPWQAQATILCDTRAVAHVGLGADATLEKAVSAAASVLWHLADEGYSLRLATEASSRPPLVEGWSVLLDRLAEVRATRVRALAPVLGRLRAAGREGLLIAVLAPPPGTEDLTALPDVRALAQTGRGYGGRVALVVHDPGRAVSSARAQRLAGLLTASGWQAADLAVDQPVAEAWARLSTRRRSLAHAAPVAPASEDAS